LFSAGRPDSCHKMQEKKFEMRDFSIQNEGKMREFFIFISKAMFSYFCPIGKNLELFLPDREKFNDFIDREKFSDFLPNRKKFSDFFPDRKKFTCMRENEGLQ
jgi:hypothetical protein